MLRPPEIIKMMWMELLVIEEWAEWFEPEYIEMEGL